MILIYIAFDVFVKLHLGRPAWYQRHLVNLRASSTKPIAFR
jgi:hypothetical protein